MTQKPLPPSAEYLTFAEVAEIARVERETVWKLKERGILKEGVHWTHPAGLGVRFIKSAIVEWMQGGTQLEAQHPAEVPSKKVVQIRMAKGYNLGG